MVLDKLRERLLGLMYLPQEPSRTGAQPTLDEILSGQAKGRLYDAYRQSWVASPEPSYVGAGNDPLRAPLEKLQARIEARLETVDLKGKRVPAVESGLDDSERATFRSRGLLNSEGKITPRVIHVEEVNAPEKIYTPLLWNEIYGVPRGEITIEHIQHSFYMAANYGFQILNGNFAAAIDDYELNLRFMNDLATYRINVSWLWTLLRHRATITQDGYLKRAALTENGVIPSVKDFPVKAGMRFTPELFMKVWENHNEWTAAFFAELDRRGEPGRFDRSKAPVIMELLQRQLLSARYIQHSARALFVVGEAHPQQRGQILDAIFDLSRQEIVRRVQAGTLSKAALDAHDYVNDIFPDVEGAQFSTVGGKRSVTA